MARHATTPTAQQVFAPLLDPASRGFVPTPDAIVDLMVAKLFDGKPPSVDSSILDPGCGLGAFEDGIVRWCARHGVALPAILGMELDRPRQQAAAARFRKTRSISILHHDFLAPTTQAFDYVIGNPPYVGITSLTERERATFRAGFKTAVGRFDLYLLFFEQALRVLKPGGRLVFITPEKFLYVKTAEPLRHILAGFDVKEIQLVDEATFGSLATYPTITTVDAARPGAGTKVILRDGTTRTIGIPEDGSSLQPLLNGHAPVAGTTLTLEDVCVRVSCGIATGADKVFVRERSTLPEPLARFAYPTVSGRELVPGRELVEARHALLVPYDRDGALMPFGALGALGAYLETHLARLDARTCATRKPWYAFHDSAPLPEILRPKLLCKDITATPHFWLDRQGELVPMHSVYYIVPEDPTKLDALAAYLNSPEALRWMTAHCQRAANGFLRLQSAILKRLPVPPELAPGSPSHASSAHSRKARGSLRAARLLSRG